MSNYVVTVLDTKDIQPYIFNSNRLRENIGASYLVEQATGDWVKDKLKEIGIPINQQQTSIENSGLDAELIYAGGGNALFLFKSIGIAKQFTQRLSCQILKQAPGLNLVAAHLEFNWDKDSLSKKVKSLREKTLDREKRARIPSAPLLGLGITASCQSTQLPAVDTSEKYINADEKDYLISRETEAKLRVVSPNHGNQANNALRAKFNDSLQETNYQFPYRMDHLGRSRDDSSYYAIIHADGNSMGERFEECAEKSSDNRDYVNRMRGLSEFVNRAGLAAVKEVVRVLLKSIDDEGKVMGKFPIFTQNGIQYLPFRPLVYGGDDVTFVCDGRLGLELAALYLRAFEEQFETVADGKPLTACAGVCIVKSHYPFARAYDLSEALCNNAKTFARDESEKRKRRGRDNKEYSAIDWHIAASGLLGSIAEIRQREYRVADGDLTMRPVLIQDERKRWRTWSNFTSIVECFNGNQETEDSQIWKGRRNKVIALREKLREGKKATEEFLKAYSIQDLPPLKEVNKQTMKEGWTGKRCGYFDAIEAIEFYFPLNKGE